MSGITLILVLSGVFIVILIGINNSLIARKNDVENSFGAIDAQLKMRYDLIPNLVNAVKKYMEHEASTLEKITKLRTMALNDNLSDDEKVKIDNKISKAMHGIMVAVENYPDLKASENFASLQASLNEVESQIAAARRSYNAAVTSYNNAVEMFPSNIVAGMKGLRRKRVFEVEEYERKNVDVGAMFS